MVSRQEDGSFHNFLQDPLNNWLDTEGPRIKAFDSQLGGSVALLREGQISEKDFFEGLMGDGKPLYTICKNN